MCDRVKAWLQKTGLPIELKIIIIIIFLTTIAAFIMDYPIVSNNVRKLTIVYECAAILTLVALIFYVYYTYLLARFQTVPSASFELIQPKPQADPYHFGFIMVNYGKYPLECRCDLNATTNGVPLKYEGFYSGNGSRPLKPRDARMGHFRINDLLMNTKYTIESLKSEANNENFKQLFHLNIKFWYYPLIDKSNVTTISDSYYFDFRDDMLKLDF
jgi:hypothetical protein